MAVFFDATGTTSTVTTQPFHDPEYRWDFGDAASGTWNAGSRPGVSSRNSATGPVAAHVFESPGTYTVTLNVFGGTNTVSSQVQITVQDPNVVFSGANTICFSTSGNFTGAPVGFCTVPGATAITTSDFVKVMNYAATGKRLLLRRGESWTAASPAAIVNTGPGILGSFGSGALPVINGTFDGAIIQVSSPYTPNISDWRIMDLNAVGPNNLSFTTASVVDARGGIKQLTLLRLSVSYEHIAVGLNGELLDYWNTQHGTTGHTIFDQIAIVDMTVTNAVHNAAYGVYIFCDRLFFAGNSIDNDGTDVGGVSHVARFPYLGKAVVSNNTLSRPGPTEHNIKLHAPGWGTTGVAQNGIGGGYSRWVVVSDNKFVGASNAWSVAIGPQNGQSDERVKDVIVERNWFVAGPGTQVSTIIWAQDVTVRNNISDLSGAAYHTGFNASQRGVEPASNNVRFYNNTCYNSTTDKSDFVCVLIDTPATNSIVENNLAYAPLGTNPVPLSDFGKGTIASNNSTNTQVKNTSPNWASGSPSAPADFRLTAGSYAINAGISVPVFSDLFLQNRPTGGAIDLGAAEF